MKRLTPKRRLGLAHLEDAESEAFHSQVAPNFSQALDALCHAWELYGRGSILTDPINPSTERELLERKKAVGNFLVEATRKLKKRRS